MDVNETRAAFINAGLQLEDEELIGMHAKEFTRLQHDMSRMRDAMSSAPVQSMPIITHENAWELGRAQ